jgi:putative transposase
MLATVPQGAREAIAAIVRTILRSGITGQPRPSSGKWTTLVHALSAPPRCWRPPKISSLTGTRPIEHQLHSANPLERLNKEIKRRSNVVGIFPNPAAVIRLILLGAILSERDDEWAVAELRYFTAESMKLTTTPLL